MDIDDSKRFEAELEFVQSLASPDYLNWLGQNKYFEDESFVKFLAYLQYWKRPEYAKFIVYPHCLFFLELLQEADFRKAIANPQFKEVVHEQQYYTFIHWRNNRRHQFIAPGLLRSSHPKWQHIWFSQAVQELTAILSHDVFWKSVPKSLRYRVEDDVSLAIEKADWDRDRVLLGHMVQAMNRQKMFSKKKRAAIFSTYRSYSILASRRIKKNDRKKELQFIPDELLGLIFKGLDPKSLVQCALVCVRWKRIAFDDCLWEPMLIQIFGLVALKQPSGDGKTRFAYFASRYPAMLLPYETKRFCIHNYVRTMNENTWFRLIETPQDHGICARAARSVRTPMFLAADEVALWLTNPCEATLSQFRREWKAYTHTLA